MDIKQFYNDVIDDEVKKSLDFGFKIKEEDEKLERKVVIEIFEKYYDEIKSIDKSYFSNDYQILQNKILIEIQKKLDAQLIYYFNNTPECGIKTSYNCHLESVVIGIYRYLAM